MQSHTFKGPGAEYIYMNYEKGETYQFDWSNTGRILILDVRPVYAAGKLIKVAVDFQE